MHELILHSVQMRQRLSGKAEQTVQNKQDNGVEENKKTSTTVPELVQVIHRQVMGNFRISSTILLKYLGEESRVIVPNGITRIPILSNRCGNSSFFSEEQP